jgi:hypothetical protein
MNTTQDEGGPALSEAQEYLAMMREASSIETKERNLRDWFAGMALQGTLAAPHTAAIMAAFHKDGKNAASEVAGMSYEIADAMLAARKEGK